MKVIDHLKRAQETGKTLISFEITPPERGGDIEDILSVVKNIKKYNPGFVHVTSRAAESEFLQTAPEIYREKKKRKRPGTMGVCGRIQYEYGTDTVCHVLCKGFSREETEDFLIDANYNGLRNIFAVQGDGVDKSPTSGKTINKHAIDLINQINELNQGRYLEDLSDATPTNFCVGGACYPEKHRESPNLETDLKYFKEKQDAGMEYAITQMFFDNSKYFDFVARCKEYGITIPIIPGLTTIVSENQIDGPRGLPSLFNCTIPYELSEKIKNQTSKKEIKQIGIDWTTKQARELIEQKVPCIHFFIYQNAKSIIQVLDNLNLENKEDHHLFGLIGLS